MRFRIVVPVICRWKDHEGCRHIAEGLTRDISARGAFVTCDSPPAAHIPVKLEVVLSTAGDESDKGLKLRGDGEVVRVDRSRESTGFAVCSDFSALTRYNS